MQEADSKLRGAWQSVKFHHGANNKEPQHSTGKTDTQIVYTM